MSVPVIGRSAFGAIFRQVEAGTLGAVQDKLAVLAVGTDVVGRKGIDLRNSAMMATKEEPTEPRGAHLIAVLHRLHTSFCAIM